MLRSYRGLELVLFDGAPADGLVNERSSQRLMNFSLDSSQDSSQIELLKELMDLQKDMIVMMLSLLEGSAAQTFILSDVFFVFSLSSVSNVSNTIFRVLSHLPHLVGLNRNRVGSPSWCGLFGPVRMSVAPKADQTSVPRPP